MEQSSVKISGHDLKGAQKTRAFALVEVMITAAILIIISTALLSTFVYCIVMNESNKNLAIAANDAEHVLEQVKGLTYNETEAFIADPPQFDHFQGTEVITCPGSVVGVDIANVTVYVEWNERGRMGNFSLSTRVAR